MNTEPHPSHDGEPPADFSWRFVAGGIALVVAAAVLYYALSESGLLSALWSRERLQEAIDRLGPWGPAALIALEAVAIVFSPIPSGPIAVVAGAIYGPVWGTVYTVLGAVAGAIAAFLIARWLGYEAVRRWSGTRKILSYLERDRSQLWMMGVVFASRLVPFISFDAVSYAAGLTPLAFWRFVLATVAGVIPISIVLTYAGGELASADSRIVGVGLAALTVVTLVPLIVRVLWTTWAGRTGGKV